MDWLCLFAPEIQQPSLLWGCSANKPAINAIFTGLKNLVNYFARRRVVQPLFRVRFANVDDGKASRFAKTEKWRAVENTSDNNYVIDIFL